MLEMFVIMDLQSVFNLDCLESSHPINIPVGHPDEINEIFDRISYLKGNYLIIFNEEYPETANPQKKLYEYYFLFGLFVFFSFWVMFYWWDQFFFI